MLLVEKTSVPAAALPVEEFKAHLRLGTGFETSTVQDAVLESFLRAALSAIEARTGKVLLARDFGWVISAWSAPDRQALPVAPVSAISAIIQEDRTGAEQVTDDSTYRLKADTHRPEIVALGGHLPAVPAGGSVEILFRAGMADEWLGIPADLAQAVMLLAAHYYEYRDEMALGQGCMPFGVTSLIERYRHLRLFQGVRP